MENKEKVCCSHILIKHNKSRSPFDRLRNLNVTRTTEEAEKLIRVIRELLVLEDLKQFGYLAQIYSECSSAAENGNLGEFGKGEMQAEFESVAFNLKLRELSQPVKTDSGYHLILRTK